MDKPFTQSLLARLRWSKATPVAAASIMGIVAFIAAMAATRGIFNSGIEIDTHCCFIPEARRLAKLGTLRVDYHLPGYPFILGVVFTFVRDWLLAGLIASVAAAAIVFAASYHLFNRLWGSAAALGAIGGLATAPEFLSFSAQATSDIPFHALYIGSLMFAVRALQTARVLDWTAAGIFVAATVLTRMNGITLVVLLVLPLLVPQVGHRRMTAFASILTGFATLAGLWLLYSLATGSPLLPQNNHVNLALTYYSGGSRSSGDELKVVSGLFASTTEVLLADPVRILRIYWQDLRALPGAIATQLVSPLVLVLALCGFWMWWRDRRNSAVLMLAAVNLASVLVLNLHAFHPRFHLYLLPLFGATAGMFLGWMFERLKDQVVLSRVIASAGVLIILFEIARAGAEAQTRVRELENFAEFGESIAAVTRHTESDALILARTHIVASYSGRQLANLPNVDSTADLCKSIQVLPSGKSVYLYMGRSERRTRQSLSLELATAPLPPWLTLIDSRQEPAAWLLFRVVPPLSCR